MNRRGFLQSCLALAAAPAIVRAESLMKLWVPPQELARPADFVEFSRMEFFNPQIESFGNGWIGSVRIYNRALSRWELNSITMESDVPGVMPVMRLDARGLSVERGGRVVSNGRTHYNTDPPYKSEVAFDNSDAYLLLGDPQGAVISHGTMVGVQPPEWPIDSSVRWPMINDLKPVVESFKGERRVVPSNLVRGLMEKI